MPPAVALAVGLLVPPGLAAQVPFTGFEFGVEAVAPGAYALIAPYTSVSNAGFVVGDASVLVVDAHISPAMAGRIIAAVRSVTDKPIRFLVNTNHHADHTFGNAGFPDDVIVVMHSEAARLQREEFEAEKGFFSAAIRNGPQELAAVTPRKPDLVFRDRLVIDLGGREVEVLYPGRGNSSGDVVVWLPESRVAFTGNLIVPEGFVPRVNTDYVQTLREVKRLEPEVIVPGHSAGDAGPTVSGPRIIDHFIEYTSALTRAVRRGLEEGLDPQELAESLLLEDFRPVGVAGWREVLPGAHRQNVMRLAAEMESVPSAELAGRGRATRRRNRRWKGGYREPATSSVQWDIHGPERSCHPGGPRNGPRLCGKSEPDHQQGGHADLRR